MTVFSQSVIIIQASRSQAEINYATCSVLCKLHATVLHMHVLHSSGNAQEITSAVKVKTSSKLVEFGGCKL